MPCEYDDVIGSGPMTSSLILSAPSQCFFLPTFSSLLELQVLQHHQSTRYLHILSTARERSQHSTRVRENHGDRTLSRGSEARGEVWTAQFQGFPGQPFPTIDNLIYTPWSTGLMCNHRVSMEPRAKGETDNPVFLLVGEGWKVKPVTYPRDYFSCQSVLHSI